jgi:hypothetical protein
MLVRAKVKLYGLTAAASSLASAKSSEAYPPPQDYGVIPFLRYIYELPPSLRRSYGETSTLHSIYAKVGRNR